MAIRNQSGANRLIEPKNSGISVLDRYTESARKAIYYARCEALRRGESVITPADLLAGLSFEEETRAERIGSLKTNAFYLRWLSGLPALPQAHPSTTQSFISGHSDASHVDMDTEARRAMLYATLEADRDREYSIDTDHLLRGLMRFPNKAHFAILKTELDLDKARHGSREDRAEFIPDENPSLKVVSYLVRKHVALWVPPLISAACYLYILVQSAGLQVSPLVR